MSQVMVLADDDKAECECDNCDWKGTAEELDLISDFEERVSAGEIVPAGQCPECSALAHLVTPPTWGIEQKLADATTCRAFTDYELRLRGVLQAAVTAWPQLDLDSSQATDADLYISGADMIEWFSAWRKTAIDAIYEKPAAAAPAAAGKIFIAMEGGICQSVSADDPAMIGREYVVVDYDTDGVEEGELQSVRQSDGSFAEAVIGGGSIDQVTIVVEETEKV